MSKKTQLEYLQELKPFLKEPIGFLNEVIAISNQSEPDDFSALLKNDSTGRETKINPALFREVPLEKTCALFIKLLDFISEKNQNIKLVFEDYRKGWDDKPSALRDFILDILISDPQNKCVAKNEITVFLVKAALRPSFTALLKQLTQEDGKRESKYCPVCGFPPELAKIEDEMKLLCSLCGNSWSFPENTCPFCLAKDEMNMIRTNEETRINVCKGCKRYIRVVDKRKLKQEIDDRFLDIISDHAHILAEDQGYRR